MSGFVAPVLYVPALGLSGVDIGVALQERLAGVGKHTTYARRALVCRVSSMKSVRNGRKRRLNGDLVVGAGASILAA